MSASQQHLAPPLAAAPVATYDEGGRERKNGHPSITRLTRIPGAGVGKP